MINELQMTVILVLIFVRETLAWYRYKTNTYQVQLLNLFYIPFNIFSPSPVKPSAVIEQQYCSTKQQTNVPA